MSGTTHEGSAAPTGATAPMAGSQAPKPNSEKTIPVSEIRRETNVDARHENEDAFMSPEGLMRYLQIGRTMVYGLLSDGTIPSYRVGRLRRIRKADVDHWLETRRYAAPWE